jgi:hypothetical protein
VALQKDVNLSKVLEFGSIMCQRKNQWRFCQLGLKPKPLSFIIFPAVPSLVLIPANTLCFQQDCKKGTRPHPLFQHLFLQCGKLCSRGFLVQSPLPLENAAAQVQFPDSIVNHNSYSRRLIRKRTNGDRAEDRVTVAELLTT